MTHIKAVTVKKNVFLTLHYAVGNSLPQIANFILLPVYSRLLSPIDFGYLMYIQTIGTFLVITNSLSLNSYFLRFYFHDRDSKQLTSSLFIFMVSAGLVLTAFECFIINVIIKILHIQIPFWPYVIVGAGAYYFSLFTIIPMRLLRLNYQSKVFLAIIAFTVVFENAVSLILIRFLGMAALGKLVGMATVWGCLSIFFVGYVSRNVGLKFDWYTIRKGLRFSLPLLPGAYATVVLNLSDRFILERHASMEIVGIYSVSYVLATAGNMLISAFLFVLEPKVFQSSKSPGFMNQYLRLKQIFFICVSAVVAGLILFSNEIVRFMLSDKFAASALLVPLVAISSLFFALNGFLGYLIILKDKPYLISVITGLSAVTNIVLNIIFIPKYGSYAAACTTVISLAAAYAFYCFVAQSYYKTSLNIGPEVAIALVFGLLIASVLLLHQKSPLISLPLRILEYGIFVIMAFQLFKISPSKIKRFVMGQT